MVILRDYQGLYKDDGKFQVSHTDGCGGAIKKKKV